MRLLDEVALVESTEATDADPLRHYVCAQPFADGLIIGNGDHVDAIATRVDRAAVLESVLERIEPEPDPPINTPRIGALISESSATVFSVAYRQQEIERRVTELPTRPDAVALQTTYAGPVYAPVGSAPLHLLSNGRTFDSLVDELWSTLSAERRVALLAGTGTSVSGCWTIHQDL